MKSVTFSIKRLFWLLAAATLLQILTGCGTQRGLQRPEEAVKPKIAQAKPEVLMAQAAALPNLPPPTPTQGLSPEEQARVVGKDYVVAVDIAGSCSIIMEGLLEWVKRQE